ncbi:MAG: hypothetical protein MJ252_17015 [archaeon]|nr:hypothetical protein [archaeon]
MKIPLDLFLRLVQNLCNDLNLTKLAGKFNKYLDRPEEDFVSIFIIDIIHRKIFYQN